MDFRSRLNELNQTSEDHLRLSDEHLEESERVIEIARNSDAVFDDINEKFEDYTGLNSIDVGFLFLATALQVARQYLVTKFPERLDDQTAADQTLFHHKEHSDRHHRYYNPKLEEIISCPVPFDANVGAKGALSGGGMMGHRVTALGHDPILGLVVGTCNIATSTLTNNRLQSFHISTNNNKRDYFKAEADTGLVFLKTKEKLFNEKTEGRKKVIISLLKEIVHLQSDIKTKHSLPFPFISVIDGELASELASYGLDAANIANVGKQASFAVLINTIISCVHGLLFDEKRDTNRSLYEVRTRKILLYSNVIASLSNLVYVKGNLLLGNEETMKMLDVGGLLVTMHRIATDPEWIRQIKYEFITREFANRINGNA